MKPTFTGGSLCFKGDTKAKKKKRKSKHDFQEEKNAKCKSTPDDIPAKKAQTEAAGDEELTNAEKKAEEKRIERERQDLKNIAKKSHRERVEEFNERLGSQTEHNDIPRVSAAGNG
jgi:protein FAM32A